VGGGRLKLGSWTPEHQNSTTAPPENVYIKIYNIFPIEPSGNTLYGRPKSSRKGSLQTEEEIIWNLNVFSRHRQMFDYTQRKCEIWLADFLA